ncbi:uncharacterized protein LOC129571922 [Sitodiplosis mosellana]|uniref:uncharacterized protein LOC129571922 n=1 Tax=Sitodiplosis mosellana TaxID=263140 RepID=UPI0024446F5D|nr:uncharacterized protein LOC129571922 [Sitodiplosis mosellana]
MARLFNPSLVKILSAAIVTTNAKDFSVAKWKRHSESKFNAVKTDMQPLLCEYFKHKDTKIIKFYYVFSSVVGYDVDTVTWTKIVIDGVTYLSRIKTLREDGISKIVSVDLYPYRKTKSK